MNIFPNWIGDSFYESSEKLVVTYADKLELTINNDEIECEILEDVLDCQIDEQHLIITLG